MADATVKIAGRPPLWRDVRILRVAGQIVFVVVLVAVAREMWLNASFALNSSGRGFSYSYLGNRAGFGIKEHILGYSANQPFYRAFVAGATNAMLVAATGIVLATLLGVLIGVARLSPNWLLRRIALVYVEVFRNTPLLIQVIFWYVAVILAIPRIENSVSIFGLVLVSNRAAAVPAIRGGDDFGLWWLVVLVGMAAAVIVWRWRTGVHERTGQPPYRWSLAFTILTTVAAAGYVMMGDAFHVEVPKLAELNYIGGLQMSPEFAGILVALVVYTAAFIGEIVRGSILAVSKGQKEAAQALGLGPGQQLRLIVLPQALRTAIPPINNQYLNLWKNTSLAFAVGFPELVNISTTMVNQAGHALETFSLVVATYLGTSLLISVVMNILNRAVALRGGV
ncbi:MAG: ABC transporter permease subunit [Actinomycetota bacterium]|nr:ABC transporter permease subunit [Actinomycetota bacterium]